MTFEEEGTGLFSACGHSKGQENEWRDTCDSTFSVLPHPLLHSKAFIRALRSPSLSPITCVEMGGFLAEGGALIPLPSQYPAFLAM